MSKLPKENTGSSKQIAMNATSLVVLVLAIASCDASTTADTATSKTPAVSPPPLVTEPKPEAEPAPEVDKAASTVSTRKDLLEALNSIYWVERIMIVNTRANNLTMCAENRDAAMAKLDILAARATEVAPGDSLVTAAIDAMRPCLSCMGVGWMACVDAAPHLRALGLDRPSAWAAEPVRPKVQGGQRDKARREVLAAIKTLQKAMPGECAKHPGDWATDLKNIADRTESIAQSMVPPDDALDFALDRLGAAAECTPNHKEYLRLAKIALERGS